MEEPETVARLLVWYRELAVLVEVLQDDDRWAGVLRRVSLGLPGDTTCSLLFWPDSSEPAR